MKHREPPSSEFIQAMNDYDNIVTRYGIDSEQEKAQFIKLLRLAPKSLQAEIRGKAKELDLIPPPSGYSDDGNPLYNVADLARHFGLSESEVIADIERMNLTPHTGNINRIQWATGSDRMKEQIITSLTHQAKQAHTIAMAVFTESQKRTPSKKELAKHSYTALMMSNRLADIAEMVADLEPQNATGETTAWTDTKTPPTNQTR